ncbi:Sec-independent protein translocase protein TatB [Marinicella litoralis]|uniref:Sec-independent protein translocase protein TatB n=1 Tax=Marinicella litoralis TaxID=644220 RepID=A0A4R6XTR6_9GAMM|nr:Sec-independent protein translocase protein TatB [Marinicella litoralis]TDR20843.1 Sec-independent protein translocase TatB [Marinicella litoralis]
MFDIGFSELLIIFVVALLVVGPERLPSVARKVGLYIGKMKRSFQSIKNEVEQELEIEAVKAQLKENAMLAEAKEVKEALSKTVEQVKQADDDTMSLTSETPSKNTNSKP